MGQKHCSSALRAISHPPLSRSVGANPLCFDILKQTDQIVLIALGAIPTDLLRLIDYGWLPALENCGSYTKADGMRAREELRWRELRSWC